MTYILLIDTSGSIGTVGLLASGRLVATQITTDNRNQAAVINTMIEQVLLQAGITLARLNAVAICGGPGSYTGLRIGMATAKGLCYALDIPLIAHNKLTLLAGRWQKEYKDKYPYYTALQLAREKEYFVTVQDAAGKEILPPQHQLENSLQIQQYANGYLVTDVAADKLADLGLSGFTSSNDVAIDVDYWAKAVEEAFFCNQIVKISSIEPFYLKEVYTHN